jgi:thiol-disulfide isomerase/thioredoxin
MKTSTALLPALVGTLALAVPAAAADRTSVPRYRFKPGQELTFTQSSEFRYGKGENAGTLGDQTDWQVWVVRRNDDGSWRLILRSSEKSWQTFGKGPKGERPGNSTLAYCDVFEDGRLVPNESFGYRLDPSVIFPRLPKDAEEAAKGWEDYHERDGIRSRFTRVQDAKADDGSFVFVDVRESPMDPIYLSTHRSRYFFDSESGLIERAAREFTQGYGFEGKGTGSLERKSATQRGAAWLKQLADETDRYFAANKTYTELTTRAGKEKDPQQLLAKAEATLKDVRGKLTLPIVHDQVVSQLKQHAQTAQWTTDDARRRAEHLGKPAADWKTTDLAGKAHALADYRGKVVVLDFWYRGCGWCIRAMPQINQLAADFQNQPVAVLGMNTDRDEKDARFVVEKMKLTYPVLKAEGLPEKYGVQGFPTLIIIDQAGKVHDIHVGYSPTLRADVAKVIKELLSKR